MIACAGCGYAAPPNAQCGYCGHVNGTLAAPSQQVVAANANYGAVPAPPVPTVPYYPNQAPAYLAVAPPKNRLAYILLGLFLGHLGIHNFYAGRTGTAVTQLLLMLFLFWTVVVPVGIFVWVIVEICTVKKDARGYYMT